MRKLIDFPWPRSTHCKVFLIDIAVGTSVFINMSHNMWSTEGKKRKKREIIQDNCYNDVSLHCMPVCHAMAYQDYGYEV